VGARTMQLPSGRVVAIEARGEIAARRRAAPLFAELVDASDEGKLVLREGARDVPIRSLALRDFHALRAIATRLGWLREEPIEIECHNCAAKIDVAPCSLLPLGPFEDRELDDPELDQTLDLSKAHEVPGLGEVKLVDLTVEDAAPLHRALRRRRLVMRADVARAMGVVRAGDAEDAAAIAKVLAACSDDAWGGVTRLFLQANYPPRLFALVLCEACGARNDVDAPYEREFDANQTHESNEQSFPSLDEFDIRAQSIWQEILGDRAGALVLVVEGGVAACDDGGEALLGAYVPGDPPRGLSPEVTVYYRTFRAVWAEEGPYDWDAELRETVEHELEHHQSALVGHDEMDDEERDEIAHEQARILGKKALAKASVRGLGADLGGFVRRTWPIWVIVIVATLFFAICER
jgi:hypothetical protein